MPFEQGIGGSAPKVSKSAILVAVGDELLSGIRREGNCSYLAGLLHNAGWEVLSIEIVPDVQSRIIETLDRLAGRAEILVMSGGLGPTHDDRTRYALAEYLGCGLTVDDALYDRVTSRYEGAARELAERSRPVQGLIPDKARGVYNPAGSAPGIYFEKNGTKIWSFPGVPFEYKAMAEQEIAPLLAPSGGWAWESFSVAGVPESVAAAKIPEIIADPELHISILPSFGTVEFVVRGERSRVGAAVREARLKFGGDVLPEGCATLAEAVLAAGRAKGLSLSFAESCTGGALGAALTDLPGSSEVFAGSAVVYSNEAKKNLLGVGQSILDTCGAVSEECAKSMALGALKLYGTDLSVAVTGIAGPGGGSGEKPVGTVWFAVASSLSRGASAECFSFMKQLGEERALVRERAVKVALNSAWRTIRDKSLNP